MKLTKEDKLLLFGWGEQVNDIKQIERASKCDILKLTLENNITGKKKRIGQKEAIRLLGRKTFLSGLSRAAFHWSSERKTENELFSISFDCSKLFE